ncbi:MAG: hypothetical protein SF182_23750 [Deltaproteobacteria bacterium]|nr:hypothetical protein [Deltaproteobacteria bacterium]
MAVACLVATAAAAADKWRFTLDGTTEIVDVVDSGGQLSFTLQGLPFSGFLGSLGVPAMPPTQPCAASAIGMASPDGRHLRASLAIGINPPSCTLPAYLPLSGDRCGCFDGNSDDGDGCSAACQVEPCFTCSGEPSVCTPSADGAPCDDGRLCTGGETCSAGICDGGTPLAGCHDLSGRWHVELEAGPEFTHVAEYEQYGSFIAGDGGVGSIDVASGAFSYTYLPVTLADALCPQGAVSAGQLTADDRAFAATATDYIRTPTLCHQFVSAMTATRCGGGSLDAGEACDDGNVANGDGCSASCAIEPCWSCGGEPSTCAPLANGNACDDGNACLTGSVCSAGACVGGTAVTCAACTTCDPQAGCIVAPRPSCLAAGRATAVLKSTGAAGADTLTWRWLRGAATPAAALGDPTSTTDYDLCIYDPTGPTPALLLHASAPAGSSWRAGGGGFTYRGSAVRSLTLKAGAAGRSKALLKLRGDLPAPPFATPLTVQLQGEDAACFATTFDAADLRTNTAARFKATR